jgi:hypothetical protein
MTPKELILRDLSRHLREKVMTAIGDHVDLCRTARLDYRDTAADLMSFLADLTASYAASQFNIEDRDFVRALLMAFRRAREREKEEES